MAPVCDENSVPVENVERTPTQTKDSLKPVVSKPALQSRGSKRKVCTDLLSEFDAASVPPVSAAVEDLVFEDSSDRTCPDTCKRGRHGEIAGAVLADTTKLSFNSLEAYKACLASCQPALDISSEQEDAEWTDAKTGVVMGYALCDRDDLDDLGVDNTCDEAKISDIKWKDEASGAVMGFSVFEDEDESPSYMQENVEDAEWEDPNTGTVLGYLTCEDEALIDLAKDMESVAAASIALTMDSAEWHDAKTGVLMAYAECDDKELEFFTDASENAELDEQAFSAPSEDYWHASTAEDEEGNVEEATGDNLPSYEEVAAAEAGEEDVSSEQCCYPQITLEWQDDATATMLGYSLCDESDEDFQVALAMFEEVDGVEAGAAGSEWESSASDESTADSGSSASSSMAVDEELQLGYGALQQVVA